ncbi:hypothetical protein COOONC_11443 [Cooperia oncophora]
MLMKFILILLIMTILHVDVSNAIRKGPRTALDKCRHECEKFCGDLNDWHLIDCHFSGKDKTKWNCANIACMKLR